MLRYWHFLMVIFLASSVWRLAADDAGITLTKPSWNKQVFSVQVAGGADRWMLQESPDLKLWLDAGLVQPGLDLKIETDYKTRFFRVAAARALPPPPPLAEDDIFKPYVNWVPDHVEILSEEIVGEVLIKELMFSSFEGTAEGGVSQNRIFAYMARPLDPLTGPTMKRPAVLSCHGGGQIPVKIRVLAWAQRGFIAIAPEFPGFVDIGQIRSHTRAALKPYGKDLMTSIPNARASTMFDSVIAGLGAFNLLTADPGVDTNAVFVDGISFGGVMSLMLSGLLDVRVNRAFSLFGCGFHLIDTLLTVPLLGKIEPERKEWVDNLDVSVRIHRTRAGVMLYAASNDTFFRPPSVNATFEALPGEKYLSYSPNDDHDFSLVGGSPGRDASAWASIAPAFFLDGTNSIPSRLPNLQRGERKGRTVTFDIAGLPSGAFVYVAVSAPPGSAWTLRNWLELPVVREEGRFKATFPENLSSCDWYAGILFSFHRDGQPFGISLSTPIYTEMTLAE